MFIAYNLIMMTAVQSFAQLLTGDATSLGLSFGMFTLFAASFRLLAGRILGRFNDATVSIIGLSLLAVTVIGYQLSTIGIHLYVCRAVHGIGWALSGVAMMALIARLSPPVRVGEVMGYINGVNSITMVIFPTIGTTIVLVPTLEAFQFLFTIAFVVSLVACLLAGLVWHNSKHVRELTLKSSGKLIARPAMRPTLSVYLLCLSFGAILRYAPTIAYLHGVDNPGIYISVVAVGLFVGSTLWVVLCQIGEGSLCWELQGVLSHPQEY